MKILTSGMDNVLAWRMGEACNAAAKASAGDLIDRGLALRRYLEDYGFGVVELSRQKGTPDE
jgi:hypothetical protein